MQNKEDLIKKYLEGTISEIERRELEKWILKHKSNASYFKDKVRTYSDKIEHLVVDTDDAFDTFLKNVETKQSKGRAPQSILRYAAVFVGLLFVSYFIFQKLEVSATSESSLVRQEVNTNKNEIVITLADGTKRVVSSESDTVVTDSEGKVVASGASGALNFSDVQGVDDDRLVFNEVYIPHGEKLQIILSDKTKVWLNAGSTLKFPQNINISPEDRIVYLDGEAFFDVTKNEDKPFIVKTEEIDVKVLGTQFNVSAYHQDEAMTTTLVEGSVNVYQNEGTVSPLLLSPSDQASFKKTDGSFLKAKVDTDIYTSWMQNRLVIDKLSFQQIMTKLERTHNVTIINEVPELNREVFNGEFQNENINDILKTISLSKQFTYKINQNVITITK